MRLRRPAGTGAASKGQGRMIVGNIRCVNGLATADKDMSLLRLHPLRRGMPWLFPCGGGDLEELGLACVLIFWERLQDKAGRGVWAFAFTSRWYLAGVRSSFKI